MTRVFTKKRVILGAVGTGAAILVALAVRPDAVEVEAASVRQGPMQVTITAEGRTRVRDRYVVGTPVAGRLERITIAEGTPVGAGEVVARLSPLPLDEAGARQASARLQAARALLAEATTHTRTAGAAAQQAVRDLERARMLAGAGALSERALEEAVLASRARADDEQAARAHVAASRAAVDEALAATLHDRASADPSARILVRAPVAGRVLRIPDRSERVVAAGTPVMELGDTRGLEVIVDLLSSDAARVQPGMVVTLTGWGGDSALLGRVRLVEPAASTRISALGVEEQRVNVVVDVTNPPQALGDNYRVDAGVVVWDRASVLVAPPGALVRSGARWAVFVVDGGRARLRTIRVGAIGDAAVEVLGGLSAGDEVVVFPSDKVVDGARVAVRR